MGKLEKVGAAVVGVLLCIIVAVGVLNHGKTPKEDGMTDADREANRQATASLRNDVDQDVVNESNGETPSTFGTLDEFEADNEKRKEKERKEAAIAAALKKSQAGKSNDSESDAGAEVSNSGSSKVKPPVTPAPRTGNWPKSYTVQDRDILGSICRRYYKTGGMVKTVLAANPGLDPRKMIPGKTVITLPAPVEKVASVSSKKPQRGKLALKAKRPGFISSAYIDRHSGKASADKSSEKGYYTVRKNDSLSGIALKQLGNTRHAEAIFQANKGLMKNRNRLSVGWKLKMPNVN